MLTRVCERNLLPVGVAEAFAEGRDDSLWMTSSVTHQPHSHSSVAFQDFSYHNQRTAAADSQTPEDGRLVTCGPGDVLARRGPESDGRHVDSNVRYRCVSMRRGDEKWRGRDVCWRAGRRCGVGSAVQAASCSRIAGLNGRSNGCVQQRQVSRRPASAEAAST